MKFILSFFTAVIVFLSFTTGVFAYSANISFDFSMTNEGGNPLLYGPGGSPTGAGGTTLYPQTDYGETLGYPEQTSNSKSIPYGGRARVKWSTDGMASCSCKYWDAYTSEFKNCTPTGNTVGTDIYSTSMMNLRNTKIDADTNTNNYLTLSCVPTGSSSAQAVSYKFSMPINPKPPTGAMWVDSGNPYCLIKENQKSCSIPLNWFFSSDVSSVSKIRVYNPAVYASIGYPDTLALQAKYIPEANTPNTSTNPNYTGTNVQVPIAYGESSLELYDIKAAFGNKPDPNNNKWYLYKLASLNTYSYCEQGLDWNGTACVKKSATISSTPTCTISKNKKSCKVDVTWQSKNIPSPVIISQNDTQISSKLNQTTPLSKSISFGSTDFNFYAGDSVSLAKSTSVASCEQGSEWDGSLCSKSETSSVKTTLKSGISSATKKIQKTLLIWNGFPGSNKCVGSGFDTDNKTSGSKRVTLSKTTKYKVTCSNNQGQTETVEKEVIFLGK